MASRASLTASRSVPFRGSTAIPSPAPVGTVSTTRRLVRVRTAAMASDSSTRRLSTVPAASPTRRATSVATSTSKPNGPSAPSSEYGVAGATHTVKTSSYSVGTSVIAGCTGGPSSGRGSSRIAPAPSARAIRANDGKDRRGLERGKARPPRASVQRRARSSGRVGSVWEVGWPGNHRSAEELRGVPLERDPARPHLVQEDEGPPVQRGQLVIIFEGDRLRHALVGSVDREAVEVGLDPRPDPFGVVGTALDGRPDPLADQAGRVVPLRGEQRHPALPEPVLVSRPEVL